MIIAVIFLILLILFIGYKYLHNTYIPQKISEYSTAKDSEFEEWKKNWKSKEERRVKEEAYKKSRQVTFGNTIENFVPFMENFPVKPQDVNFFGKPIDFIGFSDLQAKTKSAIHFIEVKSGGSRLNERQKNIKEAIKAGRIYWHEYNIDGIWEHEHPTEHLD